MRTSDSLIDWQQPIVVVCSWGRGSVLKGRTDKIEFGAHQSRPSETTLFHESHGRKTTPFPVLGPRVLATPERPLCFSQFRAPTSTHRTRTILVLRRYDE